MGLRWCGILPKKIASIIDGDDLEEHYFPNPLPVCRIMCIDLKEVLLTYTFTDIRKLLSAEAERPDFGESKACRLIPSRLEMELVVSRGSHAPHPCSQESEPAFLF